MQPEKGVGQEERDSNEMQHTEDDEAISEEKVSDQGDAHGQTEYPDASFKEPETELLCSNLTLGPRVAQDQRDPHQQQEERGREASKVEPEA